jgi:potassium-transporting ATPase ATP-binding subunit
MSSHTDSDLARRDSVEAQALKPSRRQARLAVFEPEVVRLALRRSFVMLDPRLMGRKPVMFLIEVGIVLTAIVTFQAIVRQQPIGVILYLVMLSVLLLLTLLFANFAAALAEARGKAQADSIRATRQDTPAYRLSDRWSHRGQVISSAQLRAGDFVVVDTGQVIPADGVVVEGSASVDESAISGESPPVMREVGCDRCDVTHATRVLAGRIVVQVTDAPGRASSTG